MAGEADLADDVGPLRLGLHARELDALIELFHRDAVEPAEEIEVPPGAAELAVSGELQAAFLLARDDLPDLRVFGRCELLGRDLARLTLRARVLDRGGAQERADVIRAEGRLGALHRLAPNSLSSCPAKAGHPVITAHPICLGSYVKLRSVFTGSPAFAGDDEEGITPTPLARPQQSARAWPIARLRSARCLPRSTQSRTGRKGRADRAGRTSPPRRCGASTHPYFRACRFSSSRCRARPACPSAACAAARSRRSARRRIP